MYVIAYLRQYICKTKSSCIFRSFILCFVSVQAIHRMLVAFNESSGCGQLSEAKFEEYVSGFNIIFLHFMLFPVSNMYKCLVW